MPDCPQVLLLSPNLRQRYAEDILTALALPPGAAVRYRYDAAYVAPELQHFISSNKGVLATNIILAFIADHRLPNSRPFIVPVRIARFIYAERIADMYLMQLRVVGYPNIRELPTTESDIRVAGEAYYHKLAEMNRNRFYPAGMNFPPLVSSRDDNSADSQRWLEIVRRLGLHDTFHEASFVRISAPVTSRERHLKFDASGRLLLQSGKTAKIRVTFYRADHLESTNWLLTCSTDSKFLRVSSDDTFDVRVSFDATDFQLQASMGELDALARVEVRLCPASTATATNRELISKAAFPVLVKRSAPRLAVKVAASAGKSLLRSVHRSFLRSRRRDIT